MFAHAVKDDLIGREQLQRLFVTLKKVLNAAHRVQLFRPLEESEPEGLLGNRSDKNLVLKLRIFFLVPEEWKPMAVCAQCS